MTPPLHSLPMGADRYGRDPDTIDAARRGTPEALGALYTRYADGLYRLAWRITGSATDAEDVLHDLFVGLPELLIRYEDRGRLEAWLRQVTVRVALQRLRRERRRGEVALEDGGRTLHAPSAALADAVDLGRAIAALPESLRTVFVLRQLEGHSHDEIAELLGITSGAARVRHLRALRRLRTILEPGT